MAAIRTGVTPGCIARCFLRQKGKQSRGRNVFPDLQNHTVYVFEQQLLQKSHLHTFGRPSPTSNKTEFCRRQQGFLWVNAVAIRHSSSQSTTDDGCVTAPLVETPGSLPVLDSSSVSPPTNPNITAQIPADSGFTAASVADGAALPSVTAAPPPADPIVQQTADVATTAADVLQVVAAEPRLTELGLGSHTPVGLIQNLLEFLHMDLGVPWWGAIVAGTIFARLAVFPVIVKGQREAAKLNNVLPEITKLTNKMNEAKQSGNKFDFAKAYSDLNLYQKKHDVNPLRGFLVPLVQAPVFVSFFIALRKMAYLPVPSLQTGGALWFTDLTAADPFYILPIAVTGTMFFILELGAESGIDNPNLRAMKTVFRIMPFVILPLTINFPTAVFTYWLTSNCFSLAQVALLRHPVVREKLKIPERIKHPPATLPQNDGLIESMKKGWKNAQLAHQLQEREQRIKNHLDLAAKGPLRQTFTHNPLQQTPSMPQSVKQKTNKGKSQPWKDTIG